MRDGVRKGRSALGTVPIHEDDLVGDIVELLCQHVDRHHSALAKAASMIVVTADQDCGYHRDSKLKPRRQLIRADPRLAILVDRMGRYVYAFSARLCLFD